MILTYLQIASHECLSKKPKVVCPRSTDVVVTGFPIFDNLAVSSLPYPDGYSPSPRTPKLGEAENTWLAT